MPKQTPTIQEAAMERRDNVVECGGPMAALNPVGTLDEKGTEPWRSSGGRNEEIRFGVGAISARVQRAISLIRTSAAGIEWPIVIFLGSVHLLAIVLCLLFPSWEGLLLFLGLYLVTGLGVTVGYHRKITHQSFRSPLWVEYTLALLGLLAGEGPPIFWAAIHRQHHKHSDAEEDPHSPQDGFWWAHALWMFPKIQRRRLGALYSGYAPDLIRRRFYLLLERTYLYWHLGFGVLLVLAGAWIGSWPMAVSFLAYGYFLRMVVVLHATWMVNSVSHRWGYRKYGTDDNSRNNPVVALFAHGEGWHNNHHHAQVAANHGHSWWEFDLSFLVILLLGAVTWPLGWVGLRGWRFITDIRVYSARVGKIQIWLRSGG